METFLQSLGVTTPRGQAAAIQGVQSFLGVLITGGVAIWTWNRNRKKERRDRDPLRRQKRLDLLRALWSDILPVWTGLYLLGDLERRLAAVAALFEQADAREPGFTPFVTTVAGTLFLDSLTSELVYLETNEIGPVVAFYQQIKTLNQMADDMRTDRCAALTPGRKQAILSGLVRVDYYAMVIAEDTLRRLEVSLDLPQHLRPQNQKGVLKPRRVQ